MKMHRTRRGEQGFTLVEVMIAMVVLAVGLLALGAVFGATIAVSQQSLEDQIAKQKVREALEGVYSARNDTALTFDSIQNVSAGGIFKDGFIPLNLACLPSVACSNGSAGTTSETSTLDRIVFPGPDGVMGTADDRIVPLSNYRRQILITPVLNSDGTVNPDIRSVTVTVRVNTPRRGIRDFTVRGYVSRFP